MREIHRPTWVAYRHRASAGSWTSTTRRRPPNQGCCLGLRCSNSVGMQCDLGRDDEQRRTLVDRQPRNVCVAPSTTNVSDLLARRQIEDVHVAILKRHRQPRPLDSNCRVGNRSRYFQ